ncbi:hypothetical protein KIPB_011841, partial [Kipferlia bialata]
DSLSYETDIFKCLWLDVLEEEFLEDQHFSRAPFPPAWATGPRKGRCPPSMYIGHIERPDPWKAQLCRDGTLFGNMFMGPTCMFPRKGVKTPSMLCRPCLETPDPWCTHLCRDGTMLGDLFSPTPTPVSAKHAPLDTLPPEASGIGPSMMHPVSNGL